MCLRLHHCPMDGYQPLGMPRLSVLWRGTTFFLLCSHLVQIKKFLWTSSSSEKNVLFRDRKMSRHRRSGPSSSSSGLDISSSSSFRLWKAFRSIRKNEKKPTIDRSVLIQKRPFLDLFNTDKEQHATNPIKPHQLQVNPPARTPKGCLLDVVHFTYMRPTGTRLQNLGARIPTCFLHCLAENKPAKSVHPSSAATRGSGFIEKDFEELPRLKRFGS